MSETPRAVDTLIEARWVVPVEPAGTVLEHHAVAVDHGRIEAVLPIAEAAERFEARERVELPDHALIPGLVNAHTHAPMNLLRGLADDLPLMTWLKEHIWPAEGRWVGPDFVRDGSELAMAEMLRGGITQINDMYFFPNMVARTAARLGMRATVGIIVIDFPSAWAEDADEYLHKGLTLHDEYKDDPLLGFCFAPHAPYTVSDGPLKRIRTLADELDLPIHMHVHETAEEVSGSVSETGRRPLERLDELGFLGPTTMAVHMTQLTDAEIERVATTGTSVVHCPESNLKLASGFCPVVKLAEAGVNLALGTDGAASNNDLDLFGEMRTAALLAKGVSGDPAALPAERVLEMATLGGARAMGTAADTGSIEAGKWADLTAVNLATIQSQPVYNPVSQLVYAAGREQVSDVWVAGRRRLTSGRLMQVDEAALRETAERWREKIAGENK